MCLIVIVSLYKEFFIIQNEIDFHVDQIASSHYPLSKETDPVKEYNLDRSQLVFTLGKKQIQNGQSTMIVYANTAVFSEEMTEFDGRPIHVNVEPDVPNKRLKTCIDDQAVFDYAPRSGLTNTNEQMLISLNKKLDFRKHGGK